MSQLYRIVFAGLVFAGLVLAGCAAEEEDIPDSPETTLTPGYKETQRAIDKASVPPDSHLSAYEQSLREEWEWLWANMRATYEPGYMWPTTEQCTFPDFDHTPVTISEEGRLKDQTAGLMIDRLDRAAARITEASKFWRAFCDGEASQATAAQTMEYWLRGAADDLDIVRETLDKRNR